MKTFHVGIKAVVVKDGVVLLLKKNTDTPYWEVPGGRIDGTETILQTLDRELHEELPNITDYAVGKLLAASRLPHDIKPDLGLCLLFYEVTARFTGDEPAISDEHTAYSWLPIAEAIDVVNAETRDALIRVKSN